VSAKPLIAGATVETRQDLNMPTELPCDFAAARRKQFRLQHSDFFFDVMCSSLVALWVIGLWDIAIALNGNHPILLDTINQALLVAS
jgi:hypothetical protein